MRKAIIGLSALATLLAPVIGFASAPIVYRYLHVENSIAPITTTSSGVIEPPTITQIEYYDAAGKNCYTYKDTLAPGGIDSVTLSNKDSSYCPDIHSMKLTISSVNLPGGGTQPAFGPLENGTVTLVLPSDFSIASTDRNDTAIIVTDTAPTYKALTGGGFSFTPGTLKFNNQLTLVE